MSTLQFTDGRNLAPYEQECLVIESRNKTPDRDVDRRVSWSPWSLPFIVDSGLVPPGCNDELSVVVWKLRSDKYRVLEDKHVLKDVPGREKDKNYYLEEIETFLTNCQKPGATIWYFGHSFASSGDWCFREGSSISFREIFDLYRRCFADKVLTIVTDCPHSGFWPGACVEEMDRLKVAACGHKAKRRGILIKVYASCRNDEIAREWYFCTEGVTKSENDGRLCFGFGAGPDTQHSVTFNFAMVFCLASSDAQCQADKRSRWKWKDMVSRRLTETVYIVRGTDRGTNRAAWHYVLVDEEVVEEFRKRTRGGSVNVEDYGQILARGWGDEPPQSIVNSIDERLGF